MQRALLCEHGLPDEESNLGVVRLAAQCEPGVGLIIILQTESWISLELGTPEDI